MFAGWGSWVARFRWPVLSVALVAVISAGIWGLGVFGQLSEGGYNDPNSESAQATEAVQKAFGAQGGDLVVIYTPTKVKITDVPLGKRVRDSLTALPKSAVKGSTSYFSTRSPQFVSKDKTSAVALVTLVGADDGAKLESYRDVKDKFAVEGATVQLSGGVVLADTTSTLSTQDLAKAEIISLPVVLVLLLFLFGSLVAASLPVLVGGAAVLGSLGILHAIAGVHEVNSFAVNVASLLGLGMAIDYGLFMVGRFREEQAAGLTPSEAVRRTVATAGRTVVFSATLLMIALAGLMLFPQGFLKSLAYGGLAAVGLAALLSLTLLPALLAILGPRVDKLPIKLPGRGKEGTFWGRLAAGVLRRRVIVALPILAGLLVLAAPIAGARFGEADERTLPPGNAARQAIETLKSDYPQFSGNGMPIVLRGQADSSAFAVTLRQIPGIAQISPAQRAGEITVFNATLRTADPFSTEAREVVDQIRSLPVPNGAELLVGGTTARNVDSLAATAAKLPWMVGLLVGATLLLMFFAFGSILLPIKAVVMSALSLSATFGILVWIFQDGHGASWLNVTPAPLEAGIVVLMAAVVFGLSTDYEVFLLSRMVEARAHGASTNEAVTIGLARTGRVISAAALLLIVVTGAFALSSVTTMRFVGVGMIVALLLDATVVRMLLVPAVLGLMGNAAWWAPASWRRLQERAGLAEHAGEEAPALTSGRHAVGEVTAVLALPPGPSASKYSAWDREAAGVMLLPPGMMGRSIPIGEEAATQILPKITEAKSGSAVVPALPAAPVDDDIVDAEIIEDDEIEPAQNKKPAKNDEPDDEHVDAEIVDAEPFAAGSPAHDSSSDEPDPSASDPAASDPSATAASDPSATAPSASDFASDEPVAGSVESDKSDDADADIASEGDDEPVAATEETAAAGPAKEDFASATADSAGVDTDAPTTDDDHAPLLASDENISAVVEDASPGAVESGAPTPVVEKVPAAAGKEVSAPVVDAVPTPASDAVPAPVAEDAPAAAEEAIPAPAVEDVPAPVVEDVPARAAEVAPGPGAEDVPPAAAEDVPAVAVEDVPAPGAEDVPPTAVEDGPAAAVEDVEEPVAEKVAEAEPVADDVVEGETVPDEPFVPSYQPEPYYPMPGVYRSESRGTEPDYSAPDDFFFAPSSAGTFASSLELPSAPESTVPYFGDRPDFESTRNLATPRSLDDPEPAPTFEAPNRQVARTFETPDPETSGSIVLPDLDPPAATPTPAAVEEPELDVTRSFDAPDLEATRRLQVPGLESTRRLDATAIDRARRLETPKTDPVESAAPTAGTVSEPLPKRPAPTAETIAEPVPKRPAPTAETVAEPLPKRPVPTAETVAEPLPKRPVSPTDTPRSVPFVPGTSADPLPRRSVTPPAAEPLPKRIVPPPAAEPLPQRIVPPPAAEPLPQRIVPPQRAPEPTRAAEPLPQRPLLPPAAEPLPPRSELNRPFATEPPPAESGTRRPDLGGLFAPRRPAEPDPTPLRRPATQGEQPYSFRPGQEPTAPAAETAPPVTPAPSYANPPTTPRRPADLGDHLRESRPADLGDHLRESRPADLAQYSSRPRRTTSEKPKPARRPATLADQVPKPRRKPDPEQPGE
ncbi:MMPL family transporter [Actinoplanes sp. TRM 88003]|uniref:MMPL family transporter n=1 Tax=Paractinoplanes aksuensis TaxID=2939490 RepID=A0ABT1DKR4_9ACTN|nr:MMPL family transporter [Actinoplanes aksuensis]MCO8271429.1 MMPL family transporter [Actinoplanes aksuensis]